MSGQFELPDDIPHEAWRPNYFSYFSEVEEHFQQARGNALFLLSPLDWALIESWKNSGVPIEAVFRGIDEAFAKWKARKTKARVQAVNSLAYCAQAVMSEAQRMSETARRTEDAGAPFETTELESYLRRNADLLNSAGGDVFDEIARALDRLAAEAGEYVGKLEELEQRLTALEEKMMALARSRQSTETLFQARQDLDRQLRPYRSQMDGPQLAMLEKQFLERRLLEQAGLPRLSLFYIA